MIRFEEFEARGLRIELHPDDTVRISDKGGAVIHGSAATIFAMDQLLHLINMLPGKSEERVRIVYRAPHSDETEFVEVEISERNDATLYCFYIKGATINAVAHERDGKNFHLAEITIMARLFNAAASALKENAMPISKATPSIIDGLSDHLTPAGWGMRAARVHEELAALEAQWEITTDSITGMRQGRLRLSDVNIEAVAHDQGLLSFWRIEGIESSDGQPTSGGAPTFEVAIIAASEHLIAAINTRAIAAEAELANAAKP